MSPPLNVVPEGETEMADDVIPSQLVYEEIRDVPAPRTTHHLEAASTHTRALLTHHPYENVETAGFQAAARTTGVESYHFTLCSAYGVSDSEL